MPWIKRIERKSIGNIDVKRCFWEINNNENLLKENHWLHLKMKWFLLIILHRHHRKSNYSVKTTILSFEYILVILVLLFSFFICFLSGCQMDSLFLLFLLFLLAFYFSFFFLVKTIDYDWVSYATSYIQYTYITGNNFVWIKSEYKTNGLLRGKHEQERDKIAYELWGKWKKYYLKAARLNR